MTKGLRLDSAKCHEFHEFCKNGQFLKAEGTIKSAVQNAELGESAQYILSQYEGIIQTKLILFI